MNAAPLRSS